MIRKLIILIVTGALLFAVSACSRNKETGTPAKNIVRINGQTYTTVDLWDFANVILWEMEPKDLDNDAVKDKILQSFIEHKLMLEEAGKRGITARYDSQPALFAQLTTDDGAKELKAITGRYDIDAEKVAKLAGERLVVDELYQLIAKNMGYITEDELKKYYNTKMVNSSPAGIAHILHIFTTDYESAQAAAQELASGIIFSEVARKYSEGPEKAQGGDLGYIKETEFPEFFAKAFTLKEGEVSEVVHSEYGYHIFKMVQYAKPSRDSFSNMQQSLLAELYVIKRQETIQEFINALNNNADIQYLNDFTLAELFPNAVQR